jgi:hypothetical protein
MLKLKNLEPKEWTKGRDEFQYSHTKSLIDITVVQTIEYRLLPASRVKESNQGEKVVISNAARSRT